MLGSHGMTTNEFHKSVIEILKTIHPDDEDAILNSIQVCVKRLENTRKAATCSLCNKFIQKAYNKYNITSIFHDHWMNDCVLYDDYKIVFEFLTNLSHEFENNDCSTFISGKKRLIQLYLSNYISLSWREDNPQKINVNIKYNDEEMMQTELNLCNKNEFTKEYIMNISGQIMLASD